MAGAEMTSEVVLALEKARRIVPGGKSKANIVVIGTQTSGKTSVMSSLLRQKLPTGDGIVTRAPLNIQMVPPESGSVEVPPHACVEYNVCSPKGIDTCTWNTNLRCTRTILPNDSNSGLHNLMQYPGALDKAIRDAQAEMLTALQSAIARDPPAEEGLINAHDAKYVMVKDEVTVKVTARYFGEDIIRAVTLVDLPGVVTLDMTMERNITDFIRGYVRDPSSSVILFVTEAKADIWETNPLTKVVREVDPNLERTVVVITKTDCMTDEATRASMLRNIREKCVPFVLVCNKPGLTHDDARSEERKVMAEYKELMPDLPVDDCCGMKALLKQVYKLQQPLVLRNLRPALREVQDALADIEEKLARLPKLIENEDEAKEMVHIKYYNVVDRFRNACNGNSYSHVVKEPGDPGYMTTDISNHALAYSTRQDSFIPALLSTEKFFTNLVVEVEKAAMLNSPDLLNMDAIAQRMYAIHTEGAVMEALTLLDSIHRTVEETLWKIVDEQFGGLPVLHEPVKKQVNDYLMNAKAAAKEAVQACVLSHRHVSTPLHKLQYRTYVKLLRKTFEKAGGMIQATKGAVYGAISSSVDSIGGQNKSVFMKHEPWDEKKEAESAFQIGCQLLNCSEGYVERVLKQYLSRFNNVDSPIHVSGDKMMEVLCAVVARMLTSWYAMTETVNKIVRVYLAHDTLSVEAPNGKIRDSPPGTLVKKLRNLEIDVPKLLPEEKKEATFQLAPDDSTLDNRKRLGAQLDNLQEVKDQLNGFIVKYNPTPIAEHHSTVAFNSHTPSISEASSRSATPEPYAGQLQHAAQQTAYASQPQPMQQTAYVGQTQPPSSPRGAQMQPQQWAPAAPQQTHPAPHPTPPVQLQPYPAPPGQPAALQQTDQSPFSRPQPNYYPQPNTVPPEQNKIKNPFSRKFH